MILLKNNTVFLRIPKTGTRYVMRCLTINELRLDQCEDKGPIFGHITKHTNFQSTGEQKDEYYIFVTIRHPVTWYCSCYYSFKNKSWKTRYKGLMSSFINMCMQCTFDEYIKKICLYQKENNKTPLEHMFEPFLQEADYICHLENIDFHLQVVMPEIKIFSKPFGIKVESQTHVWKKEHVLAICDLDKNFIDKYGYQMYNPWLNSTSILSSLKPIRKRPMCDNPRRYFKIKTKAQKKELKIISSQKQLQKK